MKAPVPTEDVEQIAVADWLRAHKVCFHHANRKGQRKVQHIVKEARLGSSKGFPDLLIFDPPPRKLGYVGVAIEMKRVRGSIVAAEQREWLLALGNRGWYAEVCKGATEAIKTLESLGYGKSNK